MWSPECEEKVRELLNETHGISEYTVDRYNSSVVIKGTGSGGPNLHELLIGLKEIDRDARFVEEGPLPGALSTGETVILNDTSQTILLKGRDVYPTIRPKGIWRLSGAAKDGYEEFIVTPNAIHDSERFSPVVFSSDDLRVAEEITVYETLQHVFDWRISKARPFIETRGSPKLQELATFNSMREDASSKMKAIAESCKLLEELLEQAKVCRAQCSNLVQKFVEGITKMKETYFDPLIDNETSMWLLYNSSKLTQLLCSLDKLLSTVGYARNLVLDCDKKWDRIALILSIPMAPPEKNAQYSKFDLLINELSWNLDTIQYILLHLSGNVELKWNEMWCRYTLEMKNTTAEVPAAQGMLPAESARLVLKDKHDFLSQLENGSLFSLEVAADDGELSSWLQKMSISEDEYAGASGTSKEEIAAFLEAEKKRSESITQSREKIATVVKRRLQEVFHLSTKCSLVPECFWMDHMDLKLTKCLSKGGFQFVYKGNWLGQEVAIETMEYYDNLKEIVGKEALIMLKVQHPNIVEFFGCAFTDEACVQRDGLVEKCTRGYLVMEYMPEDLWKLRLRLAKQHGIPPDVLIDILLQIVEAMIHMHNRGIMHLNLKAAKCLVRERPNSPECSSQAPCFYTVKLRDFGSSIICDDTAGVMHPVNQGSRRWMAPEVWGPPGSGRAEYTNKTDVFSFGMTCYEVITGLTPLHEYSNYELPIALREGKRPDSFPPYVSCPEGLKLLMDKCWAQEPSARPSFETIRKDLWTIKYDLEIG